MALNIDENFEVKMTCALKYDMKIWQIFTGSKITISI